MIRYIREIGSIHLQTGIFIKQRILATLTKHPRILTFGIAAAVTTTLAFAGLLISNVGEQAAA